MFERDDDGYWLVELEEEPRVHSYGRTLAKAREHILDASTLWFEVAPEELNLVEDIRLPAPVKASLELARQEREHAQMAQEAAAGATRDAARARKGRPPKRPRCGGRARLVSPARPTAARQLTDGRFKDITPANRRLLRLYDANVCRGKVLRSTSLYLGSSSAISE